MNCNVCRLLAAPTLVFVTLFAVTAGSARASQNECRLIVLNKGNATASIIDVASGETLALLPTGVGPHEVALAPDGLHAVVTNYGDHETVGSTLTLLHLDEPSVEATISTGPYERPHGIAILPDKRVVLTAEADSAVVVVDVASQEVAFAVPTGGALSHMLALSDDGATVFTANMRSGTISAIDLERRVLRAQAETGPATEAIAMRPGGKEVWAASQELGEVVVLDAASLARLGTIAVPGRPIRIVFTPDGKRALISTVMGSELVVVDADQRSVSGRIDLPNDAAHANAAAQTIPGAASSLPIGIAVTPQGDRAYVALMGRDQVAEVDLERMEVRRWIATGPMPDGIAFVPPAR